MSKLFEIPGAMLVEGDVKHLRLVPPFEAVPLPDEERYVWYAMDDYGFQALEDDELCDKLEKLYKELQQ